MVHRPIREISDHPFCWSCTMQVKLYNLSLIWSDPSVFSSQTCALCSARGWLISVVLRPWTHPSLLGALQLLVTCTWWNNRHSGNGEGILIVYQNTSIPWEKYGCHPISPPMYHNMKQSSPPRVVPQLHLRGGPVVVSWPRGKGVAEEASTVAAWSRAQL